MKKLLLTLTILFIIIMTGFSQINVSVKSVANGTAKYYSALSRGSLIIQMDSLKLWMLDSAVIATQTLNTTTYKSLIADTILEATKAELDSLEARFQIDSANNADSLAVHLDSLQSHNTRINNNVDSLAVHLDTLQVHNTRINNNVDSLAVHLDSLQSHNTRINNNVDSLAVHLDSLQSHNTRINNNVDSLTIHLDTLQSHNTRINNNVDSLAVHLDSLQSHNDRINNNVDSLNVHLDSLQSHNTRINNNVDSLAVHLDSLQAHNTRINNNVDSLAIHLDSLQSHNIRILANLDSIERHTDTLQSHNTRINNNVDSLAIHLDSIQAHNTRINNNVDSLVIHLDSIQSHNTRINNNVDSLSVHLDSLQAHNVRINNNVDSLEVHLDSIQAHNTRINNNVDSLSVHLDSLQSHNTRINSIVDSLGNIYTETQVDNLLGTKLDTGSITVQNIIIRNNAHIKDSLIVTDATGNDSIIIFDDGDSARVNTDNPLSINNTLVANAFVGDGSGLTGISLFDSSQRVVAYRHDDIDTAFYGDNAADIAAYYTRYIYTDIYKLESFADSLVCDSNLALPSCIWEFHETYIETDKAEALFLYPSTTEFVDVRGSLKCLAVNSVFDLGTCVDGVNISIEYDSLVNSGGVYTIDIDNLNTDWDNVKIKGNYTLSTASVALYVYERSTDKGMQVDGSFESSASYGIYIRQAIASENLNVKSQYVAGLTTSIYYLAGGYTNAYFDVDYCNNPYFYMSGGTQIGYLYYRGMMVGCSLNMDGAMCEIHGEIYGNIYLFQSSTSSNITNGFNIYSSIYNGGIYSDASPISANFYGNVYQSSALIGTIGVNTTLNFNGNDIRTRGTGAVATISAGTVRFNNCRWTNWTGSANDYFAAISAGNLEINNCKLIKDATYGRYMIYQTGGNIKLNNSILINNATSITTEGLYASCIYSTGGYIYHNNSVLIANNDTAAGIFLQNAQDTIFNYASYYANQQYKCASYVSGSANLSAGHDWSGGGAESFDINVNGAGNLTVTLDANCVDLAAVIAEINAEFGESGVTGIYAYPLSNTVKFITSTEGANTSIVLATGGGTALTTLGMSAGTTTCNKVERIATGGSEIYDTNITY